MRDYQKRFFSSSVTEFSSDKTKAYEFGDLYDMNRNKAFIDKLILHNIKVYRNKEKFIVPVKQQQSRMVKNFFETYDKYVDLSLIHI